jgi:hypothetical protein
MQFPQSQCCNNSYLPPYNGSYSGCGNQYPIVPGTNPALNYWNGQNFVVADGSAQNPISLPFLRTTQGGATYFLGADNNGNWSYYNPTNVTNANNLEVTATGSNTPRTLANRFADVLNILDFGAHSTTEAGYENFDSTASINACFAEAIATGKSAFIPAGRYRWNGYTNTSTNAINFSLQGEEGNWPTLVMDARPTSPTTYGFLLNATRYSNVTGLTLASDILPNQQTITLTSAAGLAVGMIIQISSDRLWYNGNRGAYYCGEIHKITNIFGNTITLEDFTRDVYTISENPTIRAWNPSKVTIRNLNLESPSPATGVGIAIQQCDGALIENVNLNTFRSSFVLNILGWNTTIRNVSVVGDPTPSLAFPVQQASSAGSFTAITINAINLLSSSVAGTNNNATTATAIAASINSGSTGYTAIANGVNITITPPAGVTLNQPVETISGSGVAIGDFQSVGYGIEDNGSVGTFVDGLFSKGIRRAYDGGSLAGTSLAAVCRDARVTNFIVDGGSPYYPATDIISYGIGSHGSCEGLIISNGIIRDCSNGITGRGRNTTVSNVVFQGTLNSCIALYEDGDGMIVENCKYDNFNYPNKFTNLNDAQDGSGANVFLQLGLSSGNSRYCYFEIPIVINNNVAKGLKKSFISNLMPNTRSFSSTGNTTINTKIITGVSNTQFVIVGQVITGSGIPAGTIVTRASTDSIVISQNATATANGVALSQTVDIVVKNLQIDDNNIESIFDESAIYSITGDTTSGSTTISNIPSVINLVAGQSITGSGIVDGSIILSVAASSIVISKAATTTATGVTLTIQTPFNVLDSLEELMPFRSSMLSNNKVRAITGQWNMVSRNIRLGYTPNNAVGDRSVVIDDVYYITIESDNVGVIRNFFIDGRRSYMAAQAGADGQCLVRIIPNNGTLQATGSGNTAAFVGNASGATMTSATGSVGQVIFGLEASGDLYILNRQTTEIELAVNTVT